MTCEALINRFLMNYHAGSLPLARRLEFELHLSLCGDCRKYVDSYRKTVLLAKGSESYHEQAPPELVRAILAMTKADAQDAR